MRPTEPIGDVRGDGSTRGELQVKKGEMGSLRDGAPSGHSPTRDAPLTPLRIESFAVDGWKHREHREHGGITETAWAAVRNPRSWRDFQRLAPTTLDGRGVFVSNER